MRFRSYADARSRWSQDLDRGQRMKYVGYPVSVLLATVAFILGLVGFVAGVISDGIYGICDCCLRVANRLIRAKEDK